LLMDFREFRPQNPTYFSTQRLTKRGNSKEKKRDIIRSLQAATIKCCSDQIRPVLVASTVIPSVKGVIWAGVFSAQDQQDPENSALALYDISKVQGQVRGFCPIGGRQCGYE
ncbi:hypothetical protein M9458_009137, partial [Cirrhinus mrigala]